MDETKYAIYIIVVEDTEENDLRISNLYPETFERSAGNLTYAEADQALTEAGDAAQTYDKGIAR